MGLAAIYLRLSRNEEQLNIDEVLLNHRNALIKVAKQYNLSYDIYQEISSGVNTERIQLNLLLERLHDYDFLLVMDIDRLSRDNAHAEQIKKMLILHDIKIITPQGEIDLLNESNEMLFSFQAMMANFEYRQIRKRLSRGRLAAAEQGKWVISNRVPLGYRKNEEKRLEVVEEEAKIIRFIFQKTLERMSANEIAKQLDIFGWRSRQGKVLTSTHISNMRRNVVYYGVVKACRKVNGRVVDDVFVENSHEPIVSKQTFLEVQKILQENTNGNFFNKRKATRKLQNLIYCNCCGRKRYIQCDGNGVDYIKSCIYKVDNNKCRDRGCKYVPIENFVLQKVELKKADFEKELAMLKELDTTKIEKKLLGQIESLNKQLEKFRNRQKNLKMMRADGELTKIEFLEMKEENDEKVQQIEQEIELISIRLEEVSNTDNEQEKLEEIIIQIGDIRKMGAENCNVFLKKFIKKIWFSSNQEANPDTTRPKETPTIKIEWI
ncbi:resolvase [Bacillus anthracis]|nr:resolvase [Bacillus anthracis]PFR03843.1 resolvase [Bacillus anthracis]